MFTKERLTELGYGYNLDCGGYAFENAHNLPGVVVDDSGELSDYFDHGLYDLLLLNVGSHTFDEDADGLPRIYRAESGSRYRRVFRGQLNGSDRECHCGGCLSDAYDATDMTEEEISTALAAGAAIDPNLEADDPITGWLWSGDSNAPYPFCPRCEGNGYVDRPGGSVGLYEYDSPRRIEWREDRRPRL